MTSYRVTTTSARSASIVSRCTPAARSIGVRSWLSCCRMHCADQDFAGVAKDVQWLVCVDSAHRSTPPAACAGAASRCSCIGTGVCPLHLGRLVKEGKATVTRELNLQAFAAILCCSSSQILHSRTSFFCAPCRRRPASSTQRPAGGDFPFLPLPLLCLGFPLQRAQAQEGILASSPPNPTYISEVCAI